MAALAVVPPRPSTARGRKQPPRQARKSPQHTSTVIRGKSVSRPKPKNVQPEPSGEVRVFQKDRLEHKMFGHGLVLSYINEISNKLNQDAYREYLHDYSFLSVVMQPEQDRDLTQDFKNFIRVFSDAQSKNLRISERDFSTMVSLVSKFISVIQFTGKEELFKDTAISRLLRWSNFMLPLLMFYSYLTPVVPGEDAISREILRTDTIPSAGSHPEEDVTHYAKNSVRRDNDGQCGLNINLPSGNISGNKKRLQCIILALLFISGIEQNPGPPTKKQTTLTAPVHSGERESIDGELKMPI
ncbi:hypothetical protein LAZ67_6002172 [Cordylochernes scorpioides]|uniref:Uncharacterized protein n=1 Tax=Cordylochernes scorpioides TaxID=51811 RepID=A0ABY6KK11_9ARAC|nr:hypothetical protein LAZ67_6002172 [Cordylochernes scorpioides]